MVGALCLVLAACGSDDAKSCLTVCETDGDCASGHICLPTENLCIDKEPAVQHCRGEQQIAPPLLDFWFADKVVDDTIVDRSGNLVPANAEKMSRDPEGSEQVLKLHRQNEFVAPGRLQRSSPYTVAAWLNVDSVGKKIPVFTEEYADGSYRTLLGLDSSGHLEVRLSCDGSNRRSARSDVRVPRDQWTHYHFLYENPEAGNVYLHGLSYYDVRLPEAEVARLASLGRGTSPARCGDGIIDPGEQCDGHSLCCANDCTLRPQGASCGGNGAACYAGACVAQAARAPNPTLLYRFENQGDVVTASVGGLDLPLSTPGGMGSYNYSGDGSLDISGRVVATAEIGQVLDECKTNGMTVEVTMVDGVFDGQGPPRIVSLNRNPNGGDTVFDLGPEQGHYIFRLVGSSSGDNLGQPSLVSPEGDAQGNKLTHLVVTADPGGERTMYIDGVRRATIRRVAGFQDWEATIPLTLANVGSCDGSDDNQCRDWEGSLHTVAIYCRPLSEIEVGNSFARELGLAVP
jgi:hypothetical protein